MKEIKANQVPEVNVRRRFDAAFKRQAVTLWLTSGKSARLVAADLGIKDNQLYLWKKIHGPVTPASPAKLEDELAALRRENAFLRQQRDILKKTLGILSEPQSSAMNGLVP